VQLPDPVKRIIEERADAIGFPALKRAAAAMSEAYRAGDAAAFTRLPAAERTAAYLVTRMPATYAAALRVLGEVRARLGDRPVGSVLDLGAGTGAASLAARQVFPQAALTLVERDAAFLEAARLWLPGATVVNADLARALLPPHDLVIAAYTCGELAAERWGKFWSAARVALVAIEPGTPAGYRLLLRMRESLLAEGAQMLAPCPAASECPLRSPDWCHFAARVERSSLHRRIKDADLGYEDEKFSYMAFAREPVAMAPARILRRPRQEPGRVSLELCTPAGVRHVQIHKRERGQYRAARQAEWGDEWARYQNIAADERR
jgi:ribosomal protein RSM22 (predicted rRNA methylase)